MLVSIIHNLYYVVDQLSLQPRLRGLGLIILPKFQ